MVPGERRRQRECVCGVREKGERESGGGDGRERGSEMRGERRGERESGVRWRKREERETERESVCGVE
jgi:hypothetical protein